MFRHPTRRSYFRTAREGALIPFVREIGAWISPADLYETLRRGAENPTLLLESSRVSADTGRWSFVLTDPFLRFTSRGKRSRVERLSQPVFGPSAVTGDPFRALRAVLRPYRMSCPGGFPPFVGGAAGLLSFELKNAIESPHVGVRDPWEVPDMDLAFFDRGVALDHWERRVYAFAAARAGRSLETSYREGLSRVERIAGEIAAIEPRGGSGFYPPRMPAIDLESNAAAFIRAVERVKEHIRDGEVFQVNLSHFFEFPFSGDLFGVYRRQTTVNPIPFGAFADFGALRILCGSPERLVKVAGGRVSTRPIAGTRPRGADPLEDRRLSAELLLSPKERAEHVMLVDLERNDLGRVCEYGSVRVDEMMAVEHYSHVRHIVSEISGRLRPCCDALDAVRSVFPGGTITGAPKVRATEIIDALEGEARGPYTGSLGYIGFDGGCDFNIVIRSLVVKNGTARLAVGAGIVADSDPEREYRETLDKAQALLKALEIEHTLSPEPVAAG